MAAHATAPDSTEVIEPQRPAGGGSVGKHAMIYGLGILLTKGVSFFMLPVYTRFLSPADYGVLELIEMTLELISIVAGAQLALGIFRFYHKAQTTSEKNHVVSTAFLALGVSYATVGVGGFLAASNLSSLVFGTTQYTSLIRIAAISLAFQSLSIVPLAYARVQDRSKRFVTVNVVRTIIAVSSNVIFLIVLGLGIKAILLSSLIANIAVGGWLSVQLIREVGFGITRTATRDLLRYGAPMMATQLATFVITFGDRYFLLAAGNATMVGLYSLAYQFGFLVALFGATPFMRVWDPKRFAVADRPDRDRVYAKGFIYLNVLLITIALGTAVFIEDLLRLMVTPAFFGAADMVPLILIAYILQSWTSIQDIGILLKERTSFIMLANWLAAITAVAGYVLLIPRFLGWGAAVATVIAFAVRHVCIFFISQRLVPIRYEWAPIRRLLGIGLLTYLASSLLPHTHLWLSIPARSLLMLAYAAAVWRAGILSDSERASLRRTLAGVFNRLKANLRLSAKTPVNPSVVL